jgi:hypothetical protein
MNGFETLLLAAVTALPLYLLMQWERMRLSDPRRLRNFGAAAARQEVGVDDGTEVIGFYDGGAIYASVHYMGMRYRFDRVVPASYRRLVQPRELFVEPGLLYVTD